jgi:predicted RNA-binding Zn-ribbon protein involved in translation (DUF1610 family)
MTHADTTKVACPECGNDFFRFLNCQEEGRKCQVIICTECGADAPEDVPTLDEEVGA